MVFLRFPFHSGIQQISFDNDVTVASSRIYQEISSYLGCSDFSLVHHGRPLPPDGSVPRDANVLVTFSLPGGKGGFGSMLRAIGAQIEKTTNREACRDLSGRRLRDINEEQRLKKWIAKEGEREAEKQRRRKERIERLKAKPRHNFNDFEYEKKLSEGPERLEEALNAGIEKRSKRSAPEASCSRPKKKHLWLEEDVSCSSDSEAGDSTSDSRPAEAEAGCSSSSSSDQQAHNSGDSCDVLPVVAAPLSEEPPPPAQGEEEKEPCEPAALKEEPSPPLATETTQEVDAASPVDLESFSGPSHLESLGLERLKGALAQRGLKCGGTLSERAHRLWQVKGLEPHQYPPNLMAKKKKK